MKKYLPTILIVVVVLVAVGFIVRALLSPDSQTADNTNQPITPAETAALKQGGTVGNPNSKVVLTEFGDYQCPACGVWHPYIRDTIIPQYQDRVLIVFKNFPLEMHKNAQAAAQAVEGAALQGKFWEMHNIVYDNQKNWENESNPNQKFEDYARQIGLNVDQWKKDRDSAKVKDLIKADVELGTKLNLPGTPAFLINGVIQQPKAFEDLKNALDQALAQNQ